VTETILEKYNIDICMHTRIQLTELTMYQYVNLMIIDSVLVHMHMIPCTFVLAELRRGHIQTINEYVSNCRIVCSYLSWTYCFNTVVCIYG
jgi:hypothetical protein